ncbi:MAG: beta-ketoacyl-[acyl-carrier-protein] synthase family protein [Phycisphaerales bacterium]
MPRQVAITGMGAVTPFGTGVSVFASALRAGLSGVRPLSFSSSRIRSTVAAAVGPDQFDPCAVIPESDVRRVPRLVPMALAACREALAAAGLLDGARSADPEASLLLGTGGGGIDFTLDQVAAMHAGRAGSLWSITNATHGNLAGELSIRLGLHGPSWCISTGCASATDALGVALGRLRSGQATGPIVVVGADAHVRWETLHGMELLGVVAHGPPSGRAPAETSRPFDAERTGFVLGEGAWAVVLEDAAAVARRGGPFEGFLLGHAATCDAFHRVRPEPSMEVSARAMRAAIADAALVPEEIAVLHYHGTGTPLNDLLETRAVSLAFGQHAPRLRGHSIKGAIGHPQGASGLAALVGTLACMNAGYLPTTLHLDTPDPECHLDYTPHARAGCPEVPSDTTFMVNTLAFGAKNSAVVVQSAHGP